jgi:hypothetical protein
MTLSVKALVQNRRRDPAERRCPASGTIYDNEGNPIGQKAAFQMWRRAPHRIHTHLAGRPTHGHHGERRSAEHSVVARDSLACGEDCWRRSDRSKHCYLNGSTQQYVKDTCPNSKTLQKCGLGVATAGTAGRNLNIGTQRNSGLVLSRSEVAFLFQPKSPLKSGLTLRGPNSVRSTQQMLQQQGIDYARGGQCNVPGRVVPIVHETSKLQLYLPDQEPAFLPGVAYADERVYIVANNKLYSTRTMTGVTPPVYTTISEDLAVDMAGFEGTTTSISWDVKGAYAANPYLVDTTSQPLRIALAQATVPGGGDQYVTLTVSDGAIVDFNASVPTGYKSPLVKVATFNVFVTDLEYLTIDHNGNIYTRFRNDAGTLGIQDVYELDTATTSPGTATYTGTSISSFVASQRDGAALIATSVTGSSMLWFVGGGSNSAPPGSRATATVRRSQPNGANQGLGPSLNVARSYASVVWDVPNNRLVAIGGFDASGAALTSYETLTLSTSPTQPYSGTWQIAGHLEHARGLFGAALTPYGIVVAGGATSLDYGTKVPSGPIATVEILERQAPILQPLSQRSAREQRKALDTKLHQPAHRLGGMPGRTFANHQRVMANRNGCSDAGPCN